MKVNDYITGTKVGSYNGEAKVGAKEGEAKAREAQTGEAEGGDTVRLSHRSREIARAQELVQATPEVRTEKVADIKAKLSAGAYNVKAEKVAEAFIKGVIDETV